MRIVLCPNPLQPEACSRSFGDYMYVFSKGLDVEGVEVVQFGAVCERNKYIFLAELNPVGTNENVRARLDERDESKDGGGTK